MKTSTASLNIEVLTECPYCEEVIDLMQPVSGDDHNEDGSVISQACPPGNWSEVHEAFSVTNVECPGCNELFNVSTLEW